MKKLFIGAFLLAGVISAKAQFDASGVTHGTVDLKTEETSVFYGPAGYKTENTFELKSTFTAGGSPMTLTNSRHYNYGASTFYDIIRLGNSDGNLTLNKHGAGQFVNEFVLKSSFIAATEFATDIAFANDNLVVGKSRHTIPSTLFSLNPDYSLFVYGGIKAEEITVSLSSTWADYVFAPDYKLLSLEATEDYITKNNHLPNIPSADEVADNGVSLGEMSVMQMEKIEELTLHLIQVNKEKEALEKRLEVLEAILLKE